MARTIAIVRDDTLRYQQGGETHALAVGRSDWYAWLADATTFAFTSEQGSFTARKERASNRRGSSYWYAYRRQEGQLQKLYLGKSEELTLERLQAAAARIASGPELDKNQRATTSARRPFSAAQRPRSAPQHAALLSTKLHIPPARPSLVVRSRLIDRLHAGVRRTLTLIAAPAGFGKTSLLSDWIARSPRSVAWVSLDAGDNDPTRFWSYVIAALDRLQGREGTPVGETALALLQSPQPTPFESMLTALINLLTRLPDDSVLVLDDYHVIDAQAIHDAFTFLIDHLPTCLHVVIASRADPPLPLARWRARGELAELRAADLRFTPQEATAFLKQAMELDLTADQIAGLAERTEGWIVGLHLAALALQKQTDTAGFIAAFAGSHHYIVDYLADEVLRKQPEDLQTFLLQTSILERLSGPLCEAVTGRQDGQTLLEQLERANLFITPLDEERRWYRYHHLFADLLRYRLQQVQAGQLSELHRRAATWYERKGLVAEAVAHALAAPDFELAARLVEEHGRIMLSRGEVSTLLTWMEALPDHVGRSRPRLCVMHARALLITGQWEAIEPRLQNAEGALRADALSRPPTEIQAILGTAAAIRGNVAANRGDIPRAIELSHEALQRLPEDDLNMRSVVALTLGDAYWMRGDVEAASQAYAEGTAIAQLCGHIPAALLGLYCLAKLQVIQGQLHRAAETCRNALQLGAHPAGRRLPALAAAYIGMGELLREWNDLPAAAHHVTEAIELGQQWGHIEMLADGTMILAKVRQAQGDADAAHDLMEQAQQLVRTRTDIVLLASEVAASQARLWVAQGNLAAAAQWVQIRELSLDDALSHQREPEHTALARVLIAQGQSDQALLLLDRLLQAAAAGGRTGRVIEILVLQALAFQAQGDHTDAMVSLTCALALAEPEGYVRIFVDAGAPMAGLLRQALSRGVAPAYVQKLLAAFPDEGRKTKDEGVDRSSFAVRPPSQLEPLSERELAVLRLIAAGASNQEIADHLVVAISTVKKHINNLYAKLDVRSRTQAVARARELNLLP